MAKPQLARIHRRQHRAHFARPPIAVLAGVKDLRAEVEAARERALVAMACAAVCFIDEVHRFNSAQQDAPAALGGERLTVT